MNPQVAKTLQYELLCFQIHISKALLNLYSFRGRFSLCKFSVEKVLMPSKIILGQVVFQNFIFSGYL